MAGSAAGDLVITEATGLSATAISDSIATSHPTDIIITDISVMNRLGIDMVPTGTGTSLFHVATATSVTAIVTKPGVHYGISECGNPRSL